MRTNNHNRVNHSLHRNQCVCTSNNTLWGSNGLATGHWQSTPSHCCQSAFSNSQRLPLSYMVMSLWFEKLANTNTSSPTWPVVTRRYIYGIISDFIQKQSFCPHHNYAAWTPVQTDRQADRQTYLVVKFGHIITIPRKIED